VSTMKLLTLSHYLEVKFFKERQWGVEFFECQFSIRQLIVWFAGKDIVFNCYWLLILSRWRCIKMRPAIASISYVNEVQKAPVIHVVAFYYIFLSSLREWNSRALLKYHNKNPWTAIDNIHILYSSCLW